MKIALINFTQADHVAGGCETRYQLLHRALTEAGHSCELIATTKDPVAHVIEVTGRCDLAISDSGVCYETLCPMITIWGNPWLSVLRAQPDDWIRYIQDRQTKWHATHPTVKVAVSNFMRAAEMEAIGIKADHVITNPADIGRFPEPLPKTEPPTIVWVGPYSIIKNHYRIAMIQGYWTANEQDLPVQWQFSITDSKYRRNFDAMTRLIGSASVVLCTSILEGCSNTLMEAIAADVPIITTQTGLFWDWWDDRLGIRVEDNSNTEGFTKAIRTVLTAEPGQFRPREVAVEKTLDYETWANKWRILAEEVSGVKSDSPSESLATESIPSEGDGIAGEANPPAV